MRVTPAESAIAPCKETLLENRVSLTPVIAVLHVFLGPCSRERQSL
jgi:hypothetical protein